MTEIVFRSWPKITRVERAFFQATEKCDGTNAAIVFAPNPYDHENDRDFIIAAQSRTRLITPENDNYGFARWAWENADSLFADLGYGLHFGEWFGSGIQRKYGLTEKRFALFNTTRWNAEAKAAFMTPRLTVVPVLAEGNSFDQVCEEAFDLLRDYGSHAVPGWMTPEGFVVRELNSGASWKQTDAKAGPGKHGG